ncbi:phytoene/squalene synthase family protein [soil metagenome]|jgi:phytoene synthase
MRLDPAAGQHLKETLTLSESYELCRQVQRAHSRTYYFSTRLFPPAVRPHVHALYAFMRYADEIVDNPHGTALEDQHAALDAFESETLAAITGEATGNPVLHAFSNTVQGHGIELDTVGAFMKSMKMDTHVFRYTTYEDLEEYTYGSAAVVGLMMCRVVGVVDDSANAHAEALGVAMQLSNFLRDVKEDWARGRIYLPLEDLERFGYTEKDLGEGIVDGRFEALMRFEISRARKLYEVADEGMKYIPQGRRFPVMVARKLYATILDRIEAQHYDVFSQRADTTRSYKVKTAATVAARNPREILTRLRDRKPSEISSLS